MERITWIIIGYASRPPLKLGFPHIAFYSLIVVAILVELVCPTVHMYSVVLIPCLGRDHRTPSSTHNNPWQRRRQDDDVFLSAGKTCGVRSRDLKANEEAATLYIFINMTTHITIPLGWRCVHSWRKRGKADW
jgi:hypothetical protein